MSFASPLFSCALNTSSEKQTAVATCTYHSICKVHFNQAIQLLGIFRTLQYSNTTILLMHTVMNFSIPQYCNSMYLLNF